MKKTRKFYYVIVKFDDGREMIIRNGKGKSRIETYEEAKEVLALQRKNYRKKDMKRTYNDGSYEWLSYNDLHNLTYYIEEHYDEYEVLYTELCLKRDDLYEGEDSIELTL